MKLCRTAHHLRVARKLARRPRPCALRAFEIARLFVKCGELHESIGPVLRGDARKLLLQANRRVEPLQILGLTHQIRQRLGLIGRGKNRIRKQLERRLLFTEQLQHTRQCDLSEIIIRTQLATVFKLRPQPAELPALPRMEQQLIKARQTLALVRSLIHGA